MNYVLTVLFFLATASTAEAISLKKVVKPIGKLSAATVVSAEFDAATTYQVVSSGRAYEANPMARPFAGNVSIFPVLGASAVGVNRASRWMKANNHKKLGTTLQIMTIGLHTCAGVSNMRLKQSPAGR
jgi:hypothetical protein